LGVKNAFARIVSRAEYDEGLYHDVRHRFASRDLSPAAARKLVEKAVEYARRLGLPAHPDYNVAKLIFGSIDPNECTEEFEFGHNGKPYFVAGPHDSPDRCRQIVNALERTCGLGGYHYTIPVPRSNPIGPRSRTPIEALDEWGDES
jgi:hypothetical protein